MGDEGPINKKPKTVSSKRFQFRWFDDNPSWKIWVKDVPNDPTKFFCQACQTSLVCGLSEIKKHSLRENHLNNMKKLNLDYDINNSAFASTSSVEVNNSKQSQMTTQSFSDLEENFNFDERVKIAEIRLATFFVEKNISFSISTDLLSLMKDIGKEPGVLQAMSLGRTKLTQIVNKVVCRQETDRISKVLRENKFAVYEDETSDITNDKWLSLTILYVEPKTLQVRCELLQMIHLDATDCSANNIFESFKNELLKKKISLRLIVGLACDNASVMIGKNSSFKTKLTEKNPNLITLPCVCHSAALAAKDACEIIPKDCERFIKGISTFISGSPKKTAIFRDFQMCFEKSSLNILKYAETRWLTRHKCIERILEMWDTLGKFLMEQASENVRFADELLGIFQKPSTKAYIFFLEFTLNTFNKYNAKFQTRKSLIHELQPYSMELLLSFLQKFIKPALLKPETFGHIVRKLNFSDHNNQLPLEEIDFGFECKEYLQEQLNQEICSKMEVDLIRENCLQFYVKASEQIRNHLAIDDRFLYNVAVFGSKTALFDSMIRNRDSTVLKVLQVNCRLGKLVDEKLIEKEWKYLYGIDLVTKVE